MITLDLYQFENAKMSITPAMIVPPVFRVEVTGETGSLGFVIELVKQEQLDNGYIVIEVLGKDNEAIGTAKYTRSILISKEKGTKGVIVKGAKNKSVTIDWDAASKLKTTATSGLFPLKVQSETTLFGAPILHVTLGVDTVNKKVTGIATVTQALQNPIVCTSHVTGDLIYETVQSPGISKIRIDLTGYPEIHWPTNAGIGPVIPKNFSAILLFDKDWSSGIAMYQYRTNNAGWIKEEQKLIICNS